LPSEWRTHTLIWRNKTDLKEQSLDDLFNSLKIYKAKVKSSSSASTSTQNIAFVYTSNTDSTNKPVSDVTSVSTVSAKIPVSSLPNVDSLSNAINADDLEEMDLKWYQLDNGYHAVPLPYTGTFMPPKHDLVFNNAPNDVEIDHPAFKVKLSPTKPDNNLSHTHRPSAPIIEDWVFDSEDESETKIQQNVPSFVLPTEQVKSPMPSVKHVQTSILTANSKTAIPKPTSNGKRRNRKACFVCKSLDHLIKDYDYHEKKMAQPTVRNHAKKGTYKQYAQMTLLNPHRHVVPASVLIQSKLVPINVVRPVSTVVPKTNVTRPRLDKPVVTKPNSPPSPSLKASNFPPKVTAVKAPMVNAAQGVQGKWEWKPKFPILDHVSCNTSTSMTLKRFDYNDALGRSKSDKGVIDSGCSRNITRNMSYLSDFEELNGGYVAFGGNPKGGSGPTWLFDIDTLTKTMNYQPVTAGNQSNSSEGVQEQFDAEKAGEEIEPEFEGRKPESEVNVSPSSSAQSKKHDDKTKREAKGKNQMVSGKDSSNPLMADNLPKTVWYSTHHVALMKSLLVQKQTALGVNTPRCDKDRLELMKLMVFLLQNDEKVRAEVSAVDLQNSVVVKKFNDVTRLQALVDKKRVIITEATIRDALRLDDVEGKGYSRVETPLFEGIIVDQPVGEGADEVHDEGVSAAEGDFSAADDVVLTAGRKAESRAQIYQIDLEHADKVLSMQDDESEPAELQEVVEVVTTTKLITKVVTAASATITAAASQLTIAAAPTFTTTPSAARRRKGVVIRDLEETATPSTIIYSEAKSKDKGKGILVEEPKLLKKQAQIEQDEAYARELEAELKKNIDWDEVIDHVQRKQKEDNAMKRYQA
nr:hypothetical protein [Tanacetum cinerariifolium]